MSRLNLVTGGAGFIGRHLVTALLARGEGVRVLDLAPPDGMAPTVDYRRASILDKAALSAALVGCQRLYHLAADPNLWAPDPDHFLQVNFIGTCNVLETARDFPLERIVYTSTESILKSYRRQRPGLIDETAALALRDMPGPYCRSKFLAEQAAFQAAAAGQPVVIVNPTMPVGPGDLKLTPPARMMLDFLNGKTPAYLDTEFNLVDARDAALGHLLAADRGRIGERYILGGENLRLGDLLQRLERLSGRPMPRRKVPYALAWAAALVSEGLAHLTKRPPMAPLTGVRLARSSMAFDCRKAIAELGFAARPLAQSLTDMLADFAQRGLLRPPILK